ncbi:hypothetical protein PHMEG_00024234 [Phytophthora megakarya]|uniref:Uncharacterized protein n=1 Tax=Phytophthora megakarya TaxID=4795 RepID=A0A225VHG9_9STRA|nr:hypothetical protein PHMEG_00024234 [Phytophthora megakarya]
MDSNHGKTPTVERDDANQHLLRSYSKPVEDDSDDFEDSDDLDSLDDTEERGGNPTLHDLAKKWDHSVKGITTGAVKRTDDQYAAWQAVLNAGIKQERKRSVMWLTRAGAPRMALEGECKKPRSVNSSV